MFVRSLTLKELSPILCSSTYSNVNSVRKSVVCNTYMLHLCLAAKRLDAIIKIPDDARVLDTYETSLWYSIFGSLLRWSPCYGLR
jgi:hypothetical protein